MALTRRSLHFLLLLSVASLAGCMREYNYPELRAGDVVLAVGDQFTAGSGASERFSYPSLLAKSTNAKILNLGRAGYGAGDIIQTIRPALGSGHVKLVIVTVGFNDLLLGSDLRFLTGYLTEVATLLEQHNIPMMLVGIPALPYKGASKPHPIYEQLAARNKTVYEPNAFIDVLKSSENLETPSQFTADGYRVLAENIEARLRVEGFLR